MNGELVKTHVGGHLPFDVELFDPLPTRTYHITVAVNNTLHAGFVYFKNLIYIYDNHTSLVLFLLVI